MENFQETRNNEPRKTTKQESSLSSSFHRPFVFESEGLVFSVVFKSQEELAPLSEFDGKSVVLVGDTPYARDTEKVKQYYDSIHAHANSLTLQNLNERFGRKYHLSALEGSDYDWKEHKAETLITQHPLKPETDLSSLALHNLREVGGLGKAEFVINSDVETLIHAARLIAKTYPGIKKGEPLIAESIPVIEDYIIAASFNDKGQLVDSMDETRCRVMRALLGYVEDADYLKKQFEKNKDRFPPLKIVRLMNVRLNISHRIDNNLAELRRLEEVDRSEPEKSSYLELKVKILQERIAEDKNGLKRVDELVAEYGKGKLEISEDVVQDLDKYVLIHMTDFYPVFDEKENEWIIPTHSKATGDKIGRLSIHFSIDSTATATGMPTGDSSHWKQKPYAIVVPLGQMIKANGLMDNMMPADTWWVVDPNERGIRLPESATIVALSPHGKGEIQHSLSHRPGGTIHKETLSAHGNEFSDFVRQKYGVELESVGNDTWHSKTKERNSRSLFENIRKLNPVSVWGVRHSETPEEIFERSLIGYFNKVLLADNTEKEDGQIESYRKSVIKSLNTESEHHETKLIPREFARQVIKSGIL